MKNLFNILILAVASSANAMEKFKTCEISPEFLELSNRFRSVKIESDEGRINIAQGNTNLVFDKEIFDDRTCELSARIEEDTLKIISKKKIDSPHARCVVHINLSIPSETDLDLYAGFSNVTINNMCGSIYTKIGSGSIEGLNTPKYMNTEIGSGSIDLLFGRSQTQNRINVNIGSGNCNLHFDKATKINWDFRGAPNTSMISEIEKSNTGADYNANVNIGVGTLSIKKIS